MKDRNVQHASRFRLTKVPGTDDVYDLIPAPGEVYEEGTLINKSALLKDDTAALFGLDATAVPDDVLAFLGKFAQYWWKKYSGTQHGYTIGDATNYSISSNSTTMYYYSDSISVDPITGKCSLVEPITAYQPEMNAWYKIQFFDSIKGKFWKVSDSDIRYRTETGAYESNNVTYMEYQPVTGFPRVIGDFIEYVTSSNRDSYPENDFNGDFLYILCGIPFENAITPQRIAFGGYTGAGTYGNDNPNSMTFPFEPKIVFISAKDSTPYMAFPYIWGNTRFYLVNGSSAESCMVSVTEKTMTWYSNSNANIQQNISNTEYYYIAIG